MTEWPQNPSTAVDVCLLLEGTYPRVTGGVAHWVAHLVEHFRELRFAVAFIGGNAADYPAIVYPLPANVSHYGECFIHGADPHPPARRSRASQATVMAEVDALHRSLHQLADRAVSTQHLRRLLPLMCPGGALDREQLLRGRGSWELLTHYYQAYGREPSFTDYFWTTRFMHVPLWRLVEFYQTLPPARLYHAVSTGFAGFLGTVARYHSQRPLLLTEHGIYNKERKIDLLLSSTIQDSRQFLELNRAQMSYIRELWIRFFTALGGFCYDACDDIVTLFETNRQRQIQDGADPAKTRCISNGIDVPRFAALRSLRPATCPPVVALVGRVVPIKDVKTFIQAMFLARKTMPELQGWLVGSMDEDPEYAQECQQFARSLELIEPHMQFLGHRSVDALYPQIGLIVFSSISEGQPLVLLEAYAAGIPAVVTDVGALREMVQGANPEDRALGPAGRVVPMAQAQTMAEAILALMRNPASWLAAQASAMARVERFYDARLMDDQYRALYQRLIHGDSSVHCQGN